MSGNLPRIATDNPDQPSPPDLSACLNAAARGIGESRQMLASTEVSLLEASGFSTNRSALQAIDRIVQRMDDLKTMLELLAEHLAGQQIPLPATDIVASLRLAEIRALIPGANPALSASDEVSSRALRGPDPILF